MLFNSITFAIFLPLVFILYWFVFQRNLKIQNILVVVASYVFYGWWDWRFLILILFSTLTDYIIGLLLHRENNQRKRKIFLAVSVVINLSFLGFFKYCNFFIDNFIDAFRIFGYELNIHTLNIILPVGISFYTFQTMSYTIDIYRRKIDATDDFIAFAAFVGFFPLLVAGPIERAANFLPQFYKKRTFDYEKAVDGMRQMLWGFFKKIVIADNCASFVNMAFENPQEQTGSTLLIGVIFFTFQIYCDFSAYSDIAIGTSRLFGFNAMRNFAYPLFSRDIAEFWRRWHISQTTWFRDYVYFPLGGSRVSKIKVVRNTFIIFLLSGFWHGANWTFIAWGICNTVLFLPLILMEKNRKYTNTVAENKRLPNIKEVFQMGSTFLLITLTWVFFRSDSIEQAFTYFKGLADMSLFSLPPTENMLILKCLIFISGMLIVEWIGRNNRFGLEKIAITWKKPLRWACYLFIVILILLSVKAEGTPFIYFQF